MSGHLSSQSLEIRLEHSKWLRAVKRTAVDKETGGPPEAESHGVLKVSFHYLALLPGVKTLRKRGLIQPNLASVLLQMIQLKSRGLLE